MFLLTQIINYVFISMIINKVNPNDSCFLNVHFTHYGNVQLNFFRYWIDEGIKLNEHYDQPVLLLNKGMTKHLVLLYL